MKKNIKTIITITLSMLLIVISAITVFAAGNTYTAEELAASDAYHAKILARAVLYGINYCNRGGYYGMRETEPVTVIINPDNPDEVSNNNVGFGCSGTCSKQAFIDQLVKIINIDIEKAKTYGSIHNLTVYDNPESHNCTECPGRALERAKGTFYQDYIYDYWKQYNEIYAEATGHNIPSVEAFFANEGTPLKAAEPIATPAPTPVPTAPPKAVEKLNDIKSKTDVKNTLIVINADGYYTIAVNGEIVKFPDLQPRMHLDRVFIPVRAVAETFNCDVTWDGRISATIINGNGRLITLAIGNDIMTVNGVDTKMDVEPVLIDERTCVPIRYIAEALGLTVKYENV